MPAVQPTEKLARVAIARANVEALNSQRRLLTRCGHHGSVSPERPKLLAQLIERAEDELSASLEEACE